ncbi:Uncharacterised protein (plasmid) [Legionella adelaidensis]|uniref:MSHA biogenesis protein MshK n=1 Tax=Legionella adelaidensis TaxID=45056 RepID=A0A0W0R0M3_9GAMM|nr:hypothetical protein [Legionella adelaidensis]KTC64616.1 hypothetical protein Lade_1910 [Legionella adelaidensis]VEH86083.1 Uncharacterised protein [Legionella adelaidensis]
MIRARLFCYLLILLLCRSLWAYPLLPKDPTKPFILPGVVEKNKQVVPLERNLLKLQSIIIGHGKRVALINNKYVKTRDTIEGLKVIRIEENSVWLSNNGRKIKLYLFEPGIRNYK